MIQPRLIYKQPSPRPKMIRCKKKKWELLTFIVTASFLGPYFTYSSLPIQFTHSKTKHTERRPHARTHSFCLLDFGLSA